MSGQLPPEVEEFARYLRALTRGLDAGTGWYGVFALRDPEGLRACLDGLEVPPWDLVQSLLQDLSAQRGPQIAEDAAARAATLYRASVAAHDAGPGAREALQGRLDGMLRQQHNAATRERDLRAAVSAAEDTAARERLAADLAWAHDDWQRATARTEELHARLAATTAPPPPGAPAPATSDYSRGLAPEPEATRVAATATPPPSGSPVAATSGYSRGWAPEPEAMGAQGALAGAVGGADGGDLRGARFAAAYEGEGGGTTGVAADPGAAPPRQAASDTEPAGPVGEPGAPHPSGASPAPTTVQPAPARSRPRGARFAGVEETDTASRLSWPSAPEVTAAAPAVGLASPGSPESAAASPVEPSAQHPAQGPEPATPTTTPAPARSRPRGARFAGAGDAGAAAPPSAASPLAESEAEVRATPRGARFAGAYAGEEGDKRRKRDRAADDGRRLAREAAERAEARRAAQEAVARLGRLRAEGRTGEAHVVLYEAAAWPAQRLPVLAEELERAGLRADVSTLLWEMACLPPARLAAAAEALVAADREVEAEQLLRQSVSRPVLEVAHTALSLLAAGARRETALLLGALIRARTPEEAARAAAEDPAALIPLLLDAAAEVSSGSQHDLAHALRMAGLPGVPGLA
ncbi:hypothetical protein QFW82_12720 [Streptomyces malaysiensis subsp. malaysiensis]|uniref:hypothetical protein n=1 Tax=Streptomyces malaysiensis TaxID=92644 RepID=UPI0024BFCC44|nr:hypothetical protein [Streptomyces sp. NA07423]WHX17851.1 hypothetical protein QFW82_12720 [Streptomyces sp. NA07423]